MDRDDLRPCLACGQPCDGDVCDERCERALEAEVGVDIIEDYDDEE